MAGSARSALNEGMEVGMRIVAMTVAVLGLAVLGTGPAMAQSLNDIGNMLKDRVLNQGQSNSQGQPDQDRERRAYEQGRRDQSRQENERRRGADQRQDRDGGDRDRQQRDYGDRGSYGQRRSDTEPQYDASRPRHDRDSGPSRY